MAAYDTPVAEVIRMATVLLQFATRALATCLLLMIMYFCGLKVWRMWFDTRLILMPFGFSENGENKEASGQAFVQLVNQDMTHIRDMFRDKSITEAPLLPSADQIGRGEELTLPTVHSDPLPSIELEAYGVKFTSLVRQADRYLEQPRAITGVVSKRSDGVAVHAEMTTPTLIRPRSAVATWDVRYAPDADSASFDLSAKVLLHLMRTQTPLLAKATESDFANFARALRNYEIYQVRLRQLAERDATDKSLAEAERLNAPLAASPDRFPLALKLAGYIAREKGQLPDAQRLVSQYTASIATLRVIDSAASELQTRLKGTPPATAARIHEPAPPSGSKGSHSVSPGLSIGTATGGVGTVCCIVEDPTGQKFLLSANHVLGDKPNIPVLQPAPTDGGTAGDAVADTVALSAKAMSLGVALAAIRPNVKIASDIPKVGAFAGIASKVLPSQTIRLAGRTSGVLEGHVIAIDLDLPIHLESGPMVFHDLIETSKISAPGDSGAPVVTVDNQLVGMAFAGTTTTTYVIPLEPILKMLGLKLVR